MASSSLTTSTSCKTMWQVCLGERLGSWTWADYDDIDNQSIENVYKFTSDRPPLTLEQDGGTWTVDLNLMIQVNDETGSSRKIRRIVVVA
jgi:hypothetical protein